MLKQNTFKVDNIAWMVKGVKHITTWSPNLLRWKHGRNWPGHTTLSNTTSQASMYSLIKSPIETIDHIKLNYSLARCITWKWRFGFPLLILILYVKACAVGLESVVKLATSACCLYVQAARSAPVYGTTCCMHVFAGFINKIFGHFRPAIHYHTLLFCR